MILAKELMEGNKFLSIFGNIETVASIIENTNKGKITSYISEQHRLMYSHLIVPWENGNQYKPCEIDPVPLTPEILEKCGFEKHKPSYASGVIGWYKSEYISSEDEHFVEHGKEDGMWEYFIALFAFGNDGCVSVSMKYLHQLQNLYYALTQTELEVKL
jgi:hypothetical protein